MHTVAIKTYCSFSYVIQNSFYEPFKCITWISPPSTIQRYLWKKQRKDTYSLKCLPALSKELNPIFFLALRSSYSENKQQVSLRSKQFVLKMVSLPFMVYLFNTLPFLQKFIMVYSMLQFKLQQERYCSYYFYASSRCPLR